LVDGVQATGTGWPQFAVIARCLSPELAECEVAKTTVAMSTAATKVDCKDRIASSMTE
jgi:hypothetical protein